ncbi:MAG: ABC transporter substrate-binding protein [Actinomycetota bacterium]|nr:ABC transporter substrate-binding protein [Actinomycetota bacterium]
MKRSRSTGRALVALLAAALVAGACSTGGDTSTEASGDASTEASGDASTEASGDTGGETSGDPVAVCELAYYTGEFGAYGESLTADVVFPVEEVINLDPPLGRPWELFHEDLGTVGEAQAARTCLERHNADIVVSIAHGYRTYRDYMIERWQEQDSPLAPTVHGGSIPGNLGGKPAEPIFRAQGLDENLGMTGALYAQEVGAKSVVIFATNVEGFQLAADAAERTAEYLGLEVLERMNVNAEQPSYVAEATRIANLQPDAVLVQAGSVESATLIKQATELGISLEWIGETGWVQPEFLNTLGTEPLAFQEGVGFAAFSYNADSPAWDFYSQLWESTPGYGDTFGPASDAYHYSTYDLMVLTALAVEAAGSYKASDWAIAMREVGAAPGEACYDYAACLALLRNGQQINYEGITGTGEFNEGGVNSIVQSYTPFNADGDQGTPIELPADLALSVIDQIATEAECDPANPPNVCDW